MLHGTIALHHFCVSTQVFLCRDLTTNKEMAMKCVETGSVSPAAMQEVETLHREINLYKKLKHHRIVSYYGSIQDTKSLSIFMEYMEGVKGSHLSCLLLLFFYIYY